MYSIPLGAVRAGALEEDEGAEVRAAQRDPAAFAPLYERYRDRVYAYLRTRADDKEDAADLTQQVFLQAIASLPRYRDRGSPFAAWLFRIARNAAINYHRARRQTVAWDLLPEALHPTGGDDPAGRALAAESASQLRSMLDGCDACTREILVLHFAAGLTVAQTAAVVGKSQAAVKKRLTRAVHALKEQYSHDR